MGQSRTKNGSRNKRYALNAGEYLLAYMAGVATFAATYVVVAGEHTQAVVRQLVQVLGKLVA